MGHSILVGVVDGENFDFMFHKKLILPTVNDTANGVRKKNLPRRSPPKSKSKNKKAMILCDSIPKGIRMKEFNRYVNDSVTTLKSFPGATANRLPVPNLSEDNPDS